MIAELFGLLLGAIQTAISILRWARTDAFDEALDYMARLG